MNEIALFISTFVLVCALGLQSLNVNGGHYVAAFFTSFAIGASKSPPTSPEGRSASSRQWGCTRDSSSNGGSRMPRTLKPGDRVSWTRIRTDRGTGYRISTCRGILLRIDGAMATVNDRGRPYKIAIDRLRHENQRTALTEAFMGLEDKQS
jgi:hypothetical protein